ncbi:MAG: glycosyltransferase family 39 protein, partial [Anaerolineae bacterium]|nr:glycosyltransferase family 39 protein [Anaerolineae bacterium]
MFPLTEASKSIRTAIRRWLWDKGNLVLLIVMALGAALRFHGLMWDAPYFFNPDENRLIGWAADLRYPESPNPGHGNTSLYLLKWADFVGSIFWGQSTSVSAHLAARIFTALVGSLSIFICYVLAKKAYGKSVATLAAVFTAFTVLHIQISHFYALDVVLVAFMLAALYFSLAVARGGGQRAYIMAGVFVGLSMATRVNGFIVLFPLLVAHLVKEGWPASPLLQSIPSLIKSLFQKELILACVCALGVFLAINPALVLDPSARSFFLWELMGAGGYFRPQRTLQFEGTTPLYYLTNLLFWGMGPLLEVISILGVIYALAKARKRENAVFLTFIVMYFAMVGTQRNKYIRYTLPMLPVLNILAAQFLYSLKIVVQKRRYFRWAVEGTISLTIAFSFLYAIAFTNLYSLTDSRIEASQWIRQNIESGTVILVENDKDAYAPPLRFPEEGEAPHYQLARLNFDYLYKRSPTGMRSYLPAYVEKVRNRLMGTWGHEEELGLMPDEEKREYINLRLRYSDYIVFSERNYDLYRRLPTLFPIENEYYRQLFAGKLGFELLKVFERDPNLFGVSVDDSEAELTFKIFDHPTIWIFKRWSAASVEPSIVSELAFANKIRLLGCDWETKHTHSENKLNLSLYWQATLPTDEDYEILLKVVNGAYKVWGQQAGQPVRGVFPTYTWREGQIIKDQREIEILPGTPPGVYHIEVILYDLRDSVWVEPDGGPELLGPVNIPRGTPPPVEALDIQYHVEANLDGKVELLGYNIESGFRPGDGIHLTLFWRALQDMEKDYT